MPFIIFTFYENSLIVKYGNIIFYFSKTNVFSIFFYRDISKYFFENRQNQFNVLSYNL